MSSFNSRETDHQTAWSLSLLIVLAVLNAFVLTSCGMSGLSEETIDDPTSIPALFVVGRVTDESGSGTSAVASAVFKGEWLTTVRILNGSVELEDPQGSIIPLGIAYNRFNAPYYSATLPEGIQLGSFYSFRVTLASGRMIVNSVKTPQHELQIHSPEPGGVVLKTEPLELRWSGWNDREACILIGPEPQTVLDVFETGGKLAEDDGHTILLPESMRNLAAGPNVLSLARANRARANGFHPSSTVGAVLVESCPVTVASSTHSAASLASAEE